MWQDTMVSELHPKQNKPSLRKQARDVVTYHALHTGTDDSEPRRVVVIAWEYNQHIPNNRHHMFGFPKMQMVQRRCRS